MILRAHDSWDNWPEIGIRDSWARFLGLTKRVAEGSSLRWHAAYEIPETTLRGFAQHVANRIRPLGEDSVLVITLMLNQKRFAVPFDLKDIPLP